MLNKIRLSEIKYNLFLITSGADFINLNFYREQKENHFLVPIVNFTRGKQISQKFRVLIVREIEWQIFLPNSDGNFKLSTQSLVALTPGVNFIHILR